MATAIKSLKRASTLIVSCRTGQPKSAAYNYKVLLLKRSSKMRVAPGFQVFPGGGFDANDQSLDWLDVLDHSKSRDLNTLRYSYRSLITANSLGNLFDDDLSSSKSLPAEISFRLCAIRETFEETGVLLATANNSSSESSSGQLKHWASRLVDGELSGWQDRVRKDSSQFMAMCATLNVTPDLNALHEWTNWVTPATEKFRFNTFFFTCFLDALPAAASMRVDSNEIESLNFYTPEETLSKHGTDEIKFIPPQLYEFNRIAKFKDIDQFVEFSHQRSGTRRLTHWLPRFSSDGSVGILPGDYMYEAMEGAKMTARDLQRKYEQDKADGVVELKLNRMRRLHTNEGYERNGRYEINCNFDFSSD